MTLFLKSSLIFVPIVCTVAIGVGVIGELASGEYHASDTFAMAICIAGIWGNYLAGCFSK